MGQVATGIRENHLAGDSPKKEKYGILMERIFYP